MSWAKPYSHMREYLAVLAALIRNGKVEHKGEQYRVNSVLRVAGAEPVPDAGGGARRPRCWRSPGGSRTAR